MKEGEKIRRKGEKRKTEVRKEKKETRSKTYEAHRRRKRKEKKERMERIELEKKKKEELRRKEIESKKCKECGKYWRNCPRWMGCSYCDEFWLCPKCFNISNILEKHEKKCNKISKSGRQHN